MPWHGPTRSADQAAANRPANVQRTGRCASGCPREVLERFGHHAAGRKVAADDQAFRTQLPKTISDLKALISTAETGSKNAVLEAATAYNNDMFPVVTDALNDVDPSVSHP